MRPDRHAEEHVRPEFDRDGAFRRLAECEARYPSAEVLLLDASRVGEDELRLRLEPEEVEVPERGAQDHARALGGGLQALLAELTACPRVDREDDGMRFCERQERAHGFGQGHRIVDEGGAMQGHQRIAARFESEHVPRAASASTLDVREEGVDHRVADQMDPCRFDSLVGEVLDGRLGVRQQDGTQMIGELAVLLLGQRRLEAAQAGFDVSYRNREPRGCKRCCQRRVDVAGDHDEVGAVLLEYPFAADQRTSQLLGVAAGADAQDDVRLRQVEVAEKGVRHFAVVVLPRMNETAYDRGLETLERVDDGCRLDEVRPGSDDEADRGTAHHELADRVRQRFGRPDEMEPAKPVFGERDQWSGNASVVGRGDTPGLDLRERREQRGNFRRCERRSPGLSRFSAIASLIESHGLPRRSA